ncbi:MAG: hypothetical protein ACI9IT_000976 [Glaciecola sp.]|jgi:hypothetical protein
MWLAALLLIDSARRQKAMDFVLAFELDKARDRLWCIYRRALTRGFFWIFPLNDFNRNNLEIATVNPLD